MIEIHSFILTFFITGGKMVAFKLFCISVSSNKSALKDMDNGEVGSCGMQMWVKMDRLVFFCFQSESCLLCGKKVWLHLELA